MIAAGGRLHLLAAGPGWAAADEQTNEAPSHWSGTHMAIEVRIPTILRTYTGGNKSVEGSGSTIDELISDLDGRYDGLRGRLVDETGLRRFVNVYLNDEDVRFLGGLEAPVSDGDTVTVLPAVAGGSR
jgi:sulfur-carrier protein